MNTSHPKGSIKVYQKSEVIFEENSKGNEMYVLHSGKVKLTLGGEKQEAEVGLLEQPGEFFGEMALIDGSPRAAKAIAEEDNTKLEVLDRESFLKMIGEEPQFALDIMHALCQRVRLGNILYLQVIRRAMAPVCPNNCLEQAMNAVARTATSICRQEQKPGEEIIGVDNWKCTSCDYVYVPKFGDPQAGVLPVTPFEKLPDNWQCPGCGVKKGMFKKIESMVHSIGGELPPLPSYLAQRKPKRFSRP